MMSVEDRASLLNSAMTSRSKSDLLGSFADHETLHLTLGICDLGRLDPFVCGESVFGGIAKLNGKCSSVFPQPRRNLFMVVFFLDVINPGVLGFVVLFWHFETSNR